MLVKQLLTLLEKYQIKPSKTMGQNFLIDRNILNKIVKAGELKNTDIVLEVGPGIGVLTKELAKNVGKVVAIEKDHDMINILSETLKDYKNVEVIEGDALDVIRLSSYKVYKVIANIPYYLTSHLIRILLESKNPPEEIVLLIQKEVAQRIVAKPPHMSLLAVSVQYYANPKIIAYVSKNCFLPSPKVDSAIIRITPHPSLREGSQTDEAISFFKVVKAGFSQPRKQLANNLAKELQINKTEVEKWLLKCDIEPTRRAETLSINDWSNLASSFKGLGLRV